MVVMSEMVSRVLWFAVVAVALSSTVYLVVGSALNARDSGVYESVVIRDELGPGVHRLSGMVVVPTPCHQLSVRTEALSISTYMLLFRTWREPSVYCAATEVPRYFRAVLFAPSTGVEFGATLDDKGLPIVVVPTISGR